MKEVKKLLKEGMEEDTIKYNENHNELGRFASGEYDTNKIIGVITNNGTEIKNVSSHAKQRMKERKISADTVVNVLTDPETKIADGHTKMTKVYSNENIKIVVDEEKGNIVTCIDKER